MIALFILRGSHYVIAESKDFVFVFAFKIRLCHQSVTSFLSSATPPKNRS